MPKWIVDNSRMIKSPSSLLLNAIQQHLCEFYWSFLLFTLGQLFAGQHLVQDITCTVYIDLLAVLTIVFKQHYLGSFIRFCAHWTGHFDWLRLASQAKICYFEGALLADQQIGRFEVSVEYVYVWLYFYLYCWCRSSLLLADWTIWKSVLLISSDQSSSLNPPSDTITERWTTFHQLNPSHDHKIWWCYHAIVPSWSQAIFIFLSILMNRTCSSQSTWLRWLFFVL